MEKWMLKLRKNKERGILVVRVYALNIEDMPDPKENMEILEQLSEHRKEQVIRCSQLKGRRETAGAGLLLKKVFELYGVSEEDITYGWNGKPEVEGFYFNLSHSEDMVICAVSEKEVGCDIEKITKWNEKIAKRFFTEKENEHLERCSVQEIDREFFRIWTMKESYIKMTGEGMKVPFRSLEVSLEDEIKITRNKELQECFFKEYSVPGYCITVCARERNFSEAIIFPSLLK